MTATLQSERRVPDIDRQRLDRRGVERVAPGWALAQPAVGDQPLRFLSCESSLLHHWTKVQWCPVRAALYALLGTYRVS